MDGREGLDKDGGESEKRKKRKGKKRGKKREKKRREELERRRRRERNVIWRVDDREDRRSLIEGIMDRELGKVARVRRVEERKGKAEAWVLIVEMEEKEDKEKLLEIGWEIKRTWGIGIDEDLTMEERRARWRIVERARLEKARMRRVESSNRELWVEGKELAWDEGSKS